MTEIENYLNELMGDYFKKLLPIDGSSINTISYCKNLYDYPTIQMVVNSPLKYDRYIDKYILNENSCFLFFLYDMETDMIIGNIDEIDFDENWQEELSFHVYDAENRVPKLVCPSCNFWLVQRINLYGHHFLGCCGYPECTFSCEIDDLEY